jgi:hypothetical protein
MVANLKQQDAPLAEVESLMQTLGGAWKAIGQNPALVPANPANDGAVPTGGLPPDIGDCRFLPDVNSAYADHSWTA